MAGRRAEVVRDCFFVSPTCSGIADPLTSSRTGSCGSEHLPQFPRSGAILLLRPSMNASLTALPPISYILLFLPCLTLLPLVQLRFCSVDLQFVSVGSESKHPIPPCCPERPSVLAFSLVMCFVSATVAPVTCSVSSKPSLFHLATPLGVGQSLFCRPPSTAPSHQSSIGSAASVALSSFDVFPLLAQSLPNHSENRFK